MFCRWSAKFGEFPAGDPELHHVAGTVLAEGKRIYDSLAQRILIMACRR